jgi:hypothetical protein
MEMRINGLLLSTVIACLGLGASGPAQAQEVGIIADYCAEIEQDVADTLEELRAASGDLEECSADLVGCLAGDGLFDDPARCIKDSKRCTRFGENGQRQACHSFVLEWGNATTRAMRSAERQDVEAEFLSWFYGVSDSRNECINPAEITAEVCADQLLGE